MRPRHVGADKDHLLLAGPRCLQEPLSVHLGRSLLLCRRSHTKSEIAQTRVTNETTRPAVVTAVFTKRNDTPAKNWKEWEGTLAPGHYYTPDLAKARLDLHNQGICPRVSLNGAGSMTRLRYKDVTIHKHYQEALACKRFCTEFESIHKRPLIYTGGSLSSFCGSVFRELCHPPITRKKLSEAQHEQIWEKQGRCCNLCGNPAADRTNVDHISPKFQGGGDNLDNLQIICVPCHSSKSMLETLSFVEDEHPLLSRFSLETYRAFVESDKPPQLVASLAEIELGAISVDVIRCRFNALTESDCPIPVYCPADAPVPRTTEELADYMWLDLETPDARRSLLSLLPYFGSAWYGRETVAFLLDAGIAKWSDIRLSFNASTHRPASYLADRLSQSDGGDLEARCRKYCWRDVS